MRKTFCNDDIKEYTEKNRLPYSVHWTLTEECNLRCLHCYLAKKPRYASFDDARYIIPFIKEKGYLKATLSGGECLINPDFAKIYMMLKQSGFIVSIMTNGTNFTPELQEMIRQYPPSEVYVSIYGVDDASFQKATNSKVSFKRFIDGLEFLKSVKTRTTIQAPITQGNIDKIETFKEIAGTYGCNWHFATFIFDSETGETQPVAERLPAKEIVDYICRDEQTVRDFWDKLRLLNEPPVPFEDKCSSCRNNLTINADNSFSFCGMMETIKFPFNRDTIDDSYQSTITFKEKAISLYNESSCAGCRLRNICPGCPAHCKLESGDFSKCNQYYREMTEYMIRKIDSKYHAKGSE